MALKQGQTCVIVGKSGSGKSTLLNIIGGLDKATGGTVCVGGMNVSSMPEKQLVKFRREFLGMIFQFHYLLKDFILINSICSFQGTCWYESFLFIPSGDGEIRTLDPLLARQVLSQLSYTPTNPGSHLLSHAVSSIVPSAA